MIRPLAVLVLALGLSPAIAAEAPAAPAGPAPKAKVVCTSDRSTGSHLRRRTCQTEAQRDARR